MHVPAWKKLGLKLKYAKEEAPLQRDQRDNGRDLSIRAREDDADAVKEKKKKNKRRLSEDGAGAREEDGSEKKKKKQ
ncbi:hypothetical protein LTS12_028299, partial [Elasticomyces elasticus]